MMRGAFPMVLAKKMTAMRRHWRRIWRFKNLLKMKKKGMMMCMLRLAVVLVRKFVKSNLEKLMRIK